MMMTMNIVRSIALAGVTVGAACTASAALAQATYDRPAAIEADEAYGDAAVQAVPSNRRGQFSCGYNEVHTRLERKNCGGVHYRY